MRSDSWHPFAVAPDVLWTRMAAVDEFRTWWPWLRSFDGQGLHAGEVWTCVIQPPLPYRLRFDLRLDEVVPAVRVRATLAGDIVGTAAFDLHPVPTGCEMHLVSALAPAHPALRALLTVARPVAQLSHSSTSLM